MEKEKINKIIESLEAVLKRPKMYFGKDDDVDIANSFLSGVRFGFCNAFDLREFAVSFYGDSVVKKGHRFSPRGVVKELKDEGLSDKQIVEELTEIQIEFFRILRSKVSDKCAE